ncbi:MAG TPA: response regulator transcription factor [Candidatus Merdenecus merdavium]|nr:response regulator transcription factor [Candidatus Merdenecus merdavium]
MIRIAIVEDQQEHVDVLCDYLDRYRKDHAQEFQITIFSDGLDIVTEYNAQYDIILLDIQMKHLDGMKTAERIRQLDEDVAFIFITSTVQYAVQGYQVNALGYVLKPVSYLAFSQVIEKAVKQQSKKQKTDFLTIDVEGGHMRLELNQIYYLESQNHYVLIHSEKGDFLTQGPLKRFDDLLESKGFSRCHHAYLVNMKHVTGIQHNNALITDGGHVVISRAKKKGFLDSLTNYIGGIS